MNMQSIVARGAPRCAVAVAFLVSALGAAPAWGQEIKWEQPPRIQPISDPCFFGWDERSDFEFGPIAADDWVCEDPRPVSDIHWWGSYIEWEEPFPPPDAPPAYHIGIWTDVPPGPDPFSHPGMMIREWIVERELLEEHWVGCDFHPDYPPEATFYYTFIIPEGDWFIQEPGCNIYWISIAAIYPPLCPCFGDMNGDGVVDPFDIDPFAACLGQPPVGVCAPADLNCDNAIDGLDIQIFNCQLVEPDPSVCCPNDPGEPQFPWGWKTRLRDPDSPAPDDAVRIFFPTAPHPGAFYEFGEPIEDAFGSWDMAFVLTTQEGPEPEACCLPPPADPSCVDIPREDCLNQDGQPQGPGTACGPEEACCLPDGTCAMLDPQCCEAWDGAAQGSNTMCTEEEACCLPDGTCVMLDPLCCLDMNGVPQGPDSMCTELQGCCLDDGVCLDLDPLCCEEMGGTPQGPETGCVDMTIACCLPNGDCANVDPLCCDDLNGVPSPIGAPQCMGDMNGNEIDDACEESPTGACCDRATCLENLTRAECDALFGTYLGDDTDCGPPNPCAGACCDPETGDCEETDEIGCHKMHYEQLPDPFGWDVMATQPLILADDFECTQTGPIRDIHFWGSWRGNMVGQIVLARFSIHADIPADQSPTGYSMPGELLWSWVEPPGPPGNEPASLQGWFDPASGEFQLNDHDLWFRYDVYIPEDIAFIQEEGTIYWLDIQIVTEGGLWGWKTTQNHWNDDAVWGHFLPGQDPNLIEWGELRDPETGESLDLAFVITGGDFLGPGTVCDPNPCPQPHPQNDDCDDALSISDVVGLPFDTTNATFDGPGLCMTSPNIWYCYTAPCDGTVHIDLCDSDYDTKVGVYEGCVCYPDAFIACNDDSDCDGIPGNELQSQIWFNATAGQQYLIEVGGFSSNTGTGNLSVTCVPTQACCLPDGSCQDLTHMDCVNQGGDPQGPNTTCDSLPDACVPLKWAQPPVFNPFSPFPDCFYGWDELSVYGSMEQIVADDWHCADARPITDVHWWGSYLNWMEGEPPSGAPEWFHLGIWKDVPAGVDLPYSHPGEMIWQWIVPREALDERVVGCDFHPQMTETPDTCFRYDFLVPESEWFFQDPAENNIYWLSVSARYSPLDCECNADVNGDGAVNPFDVLRLRDCIEGILPPEACPGGDVDCDGDLDEHDVGAVSCVIAAGGNDPTCCQRGFEYAWGWKTREHFFMDDAVRIFFPTAPIPGMTFLEGVPIELEGVSWDMAFVLTSTVEIPPEACCLPPDNDPSCIDVPPDDCEALGGTPQGPGTQCEGFTIACCLDDGDCVDVDPICCDDLGGTPSPIGEPVCLDDNDGNGIDDACQLPTGACCRGPFCTIETEDGCAQINGIYQGDGTDCGTDIFAATPNLAIPDDDPAGISHTIDVPNASRDTIVDVDIDVVIDHTYLGDLVISVEHDGVTVELWDRACSFNDDMNVLFDDEGNPVVCATPTIGRITPISAMGEALTAFDGLDPAGSWTITVSDNAGLDTGTLVRWSIHLTDPAGNPCDPPKACCLPDGSCADIGHVPCVNMGGDPQGPDTSCDTLPQACNELKWAQPPTFHPQSPVPECFWGWDEFSHFACPGCQFLADDWLCQSNRPVTDIHWWGSYRFWDIPEPPPDGPLGFHIGIWTNVPAGVDLPYSHPGVMIWQWFVPRDVLNERPMACDFHPTHPEPETCFRYDFYIPPEEWFFQGTEDEIYWVSIAADYGGPVPPNAWGWKTREHFFEDDAIIIFAPNPPQIGEPFLEGIPLEDPEGNSWDLAFVLTTGEEVELYPKWVQPPNDPSLEFDAPSNLWWPNPLEPPPSQLKWSQPPEPGPAECFYGWDEPSSFTGPQYVGDDWVCMDDRPITDVHWWGSYRGWLEPEPPPNYPWIGFHIGIWTDVPAGVDTDFSHPGEMIWEWFVPYEQANEVAVGCDEHPDHPLDTAFRYSYQIPEDQWFFQDPTGDPTVYWITVSAATDGDPFPPWGWKTRPFMEMAPDVAVRIFDPIPPMLGMSYGFGEPIFDSLGDPFDMAFELTTRPEVIKIVADDFISDGREITRVKWWGSYYDERFLPDFPDNLYEIDGWLLSFHYADANQFPGCPPDLMADPPPTALGIYFVPADAVEIVGIDMTDCLGHAVYEYTVDLAQCCLLCSEMDPRTGEFPAQPPLFKESAALRYWLGVQAVTGVEWQRPECEMNFTGHLPSDLPGNNGDFWGWYTSTAEETTSHGRLDTACTGAIVDFGPYPPNCWDYSEWDVPLYLCPGVPEPEPEIHMAFALMTPEELPRPFVLHLNGQSGETHVCSGYIDPRGESTDGVALDLGLQSTEVQFNVPVFGNNAGGPVTAANFSLAETGAGAAPNITGVTPLTARLFRIDWDRPLTLQEWTTLKANVFDAMGRVIHTVGDLGPNVDEPDRVDIGYLPADIDQNSVVSPFDLLRFRQYVNGQAAPDCGVLLDYLDMDRNTVVSPFDLLRYRQEINGLVPATQPWAGQAMNNPRP